MEVTDQRLCDDIIKLVATRDCPRANIMRGETLAYYCDECGQADETLKQIYHDAECGYAGEHGRQLYDAIRTDGGVLSARSPEFEHDHHIEALVADFTTKTVRLGETIAWWCHECANADETLWETRHDEDCRLAGRHS